MRIRVNAPLKVLPMTAALLSGSIVCAAPPVVLMAPDPQPLDYFGTAVTATPDRIVTGYPARYPSLKGRIFTFVRTGSQWSIESVWASERYGDGLGTSLAMQGELVVVGAPWRKHHVADNTNLHGYFYVLNRQPSGALAPVLEFIGGMPGEQYGESFAIDGDWALVGAPGGRPPQGPDTPRRGEVRFISIGGATFTLGPVFYPLEPPAQRGFGQSVCLSGEWAAVSANVVGGSAPMAGLVSILRRQIDNTWSIVDSIMAPIPYPGDRFGLALAMRGDLLVTGAPAPGQLGEFARGAAYIYRLENDAWTLEQTIEAPISKFCEGFGRSIAIGDDTIAIGAEEFGEAENTEATVFVYTRTRSMGGNGDGNGDDNGDPWIHSGSYTGLASEDFGASLAFAGSRLVIGIPGTTLGDEGTGHGAVMVIDPILADLNGDGIVNGADLGLLLGAWGAAAPGEPADLNGDGIVNGADLGLLLEQWS